MAEDTTTSVEAVVGHADGEILPGGEKVVYEFDKDGQFTGWHKETVKG